MVSKKSLIFIVNSHFANVYAAIDHVYIETDIFIIPKRYTVPFFSGIAVHESMATALDFDLVLMYGRV